MSKKLRVIGFGIGTSCKDYLKSYSDEHDIIALCDWDENTHGTQRYGYDIVNPHTLDFSKIDKILILSFYVKEIIEQLKERCNIDTNKIIIPPKYKIKGMKLPFEDPKTKEFARSMVFFFMDLAEREGIEIFIDFGTLLGIARGGDLIDWDDDIDFAIKEQDAKKMAEILFKLKDKLPENDKIKWESNIGKDSEGNIWSLSLKVKNKNEMVYRPFNISFGIKKFYKNRAISMNFKFLSAPEEHFKEKTTIAFFGKSLRAPYNYKDYLTLLYDDWKTPQVYTFASEYGTSHQAPIEPEVKVEILKTTFF